MPGVHYNLYIMWVESVSIESNVQSGQMYHRVSNIHTYIRQRQSVTVHYEQFIIIYYVSEYQLPHVIDASHTTPITCVNRGPMLLKLIGWKHCPYFR